MLRIAAIVKALQPVHFVRTMLHRPMSFRFCLPNICSLKNTYKHGSNFISLISTNCKKMDTEKYQKLMSFYVCWQFQEIGICSIPTLGAHTKVNILLYIHAEKKTASGGTGTRGFYLHDSSLTGVYHLICITTCVHSVRFLLVVGSDTVFSLVLVHGLKVTAIYLSKKVTAISLAPHI
jgi:hypothetical protein